MPATAVRSDVGARSIGLISLAILGGALVAGCGRATPIPDGAQVVHVAITDSEVRLDPAAVGAGDVYLILEEPTGGSLTVVEHKGTADATPGPMSPDDLARLSRGDTQFMAISGLDAGGCHPDQDAEDRGQMGPCGNVMMLTVAPGMYAIVGGSPEGDPSTGRVPPMAVLVVGE